MNNIFLKIDLTSSKKPEKKKIAISKAEDYGQVLTSIKNEEDREEQSEKLFQIGTTFYNYYFCRLNSLFFCQKNKFLAFLDSYNY